MPHGTAQRSKTPITLKGSTTIVTEFFWFCINSILYQREVYPHDKFVSKKKYGLPLLVAADPELKQFLEGVLKQFKTWLMEKKIEQLVLVLVGTESKQTLERWVFKIEAEAEGSENVVSRSEQEITREIQALMKQIVGSVTFLPVPTEPRTFDLLIHTAHDVDVPEEWEESDPHFLANGEVVKLRSFNTSIHNVQGSVAYRMDWGEQ